MSQTCRTNVKVRARARARAFYTVISAPACSRSRCLCVGVCASSGWNCLLVHRVVCVFSTWVGAGVCGDLTGGEYCLGAAY